MSTPKEVFDNSLQHRDFLQSVDFEMSYCCPYNPNELDMGVVKVFKEAFLERRGVQYGHSPEDILYYEGALLKDESNGNYVFTNAGYLFFASKSSQAFRGRICGELYIMIFSMKTLEIMRRQLSTKNSRDLYRTLSIIFNHF